MPGVIYDFRTFEAVEANVITDYIVGTPSGEVIDVNSEMFVTLKKQRLIVYNQKTKYFTFLDQNYKYISKMVDDITARDPNRIQYIHYVMDQLGISNYKVGADLIVDVNGDVDISQRRLTSIPVKFGKVTGNFDCSINKLYKLTNSPDEVHGFFECSHNQIYTLIGGPKYVVGGYYCANNQLDDLMGFPTYCSTCFDVTDNNLKTLKGCPDEVDVRFFSVSRNKLMNLSNGPRKTRDFDCSHNMITTLENGIKDVRGNFICTHNRLTNLYGMPSCNKILYEEGNKIEIDHD